MTALLVNCGRFAAGYTASMAAAAAAAPAAARRAPSAAAAFPAAAATAALAVPAGGGRAEWGAGDAQPVFKACRPASAACWNAWEPGATGAVEQEQTHEQGADGSVIA